MKNMVKVTIAALAVGVLAMCGNMTGYATESADAVSTQANEDGSTDAGGSNQNIYTVTYNLNGGTKDGKPTYRPTYNSESWTVDLSKITPERDGYRLTGWWYTDTNNIEHKIDTKETIKLDEYFPNIREAKLTAEWTQEVTVTVDRTNAGTVAAGNTYVVEPAAPALSEWNLDKWVVNENHDIAPGENGSGSITVKPTEAVNHVINIDGEKTGFGITSKNPNANFVSYWSPQNGYLVQVKNETGHPLKFSGKTLNDKATSDPDFFGIITKLPEKTDDKYFTILNPSIENQVIGKNGKYVTYGGYHVKAYDLTLNASDVQRNIKISFKSQTDVTYTNTNLEMALPTNNGLLTPQELLGTASATRKGFEKYRWSYSVKDIDGKDTVAENIPDGKWAESAGGILEKKFNYSFPYYEFEFAPVWQCQINFETGFPTTETEGVPEKPASLEQDEKSIFTKFPELNDSKNRYEFKGWKLERDTSNTLYKNNTKYTVTSPSVTFVGQWEAIRYQILWNLGYEDGGLREENITYGKNIAFPTDPTRPGYTFLGWEMSVGDASTDNGVKISEKLYKAGDEVMMPAGAVTMTAQWQINTYTVTYNGNGGTIGIYTGRDDVTYNASYKIKNVSGITPTRFGYQFCGWKINGSGDTLQAGSSFTMPANDVTLVAQWEATSSKSYKMEQGVGYTYNGAFRIKGDPSNYQEKITFYVPEAGEYTFE